MKRNNGSSDARAVTALVLSMVGQVCKDLKELFDMGFRSFVVGRTASGGVHAFCDCAHECLAHVSKSLTTSPLCII